MAGAEYAAIPAYTGNAAYAAIPKISKTGKTLISYFAGLAVTAPTITVTVTTASRDLRKRT